MGKSDENCKSKYVAITGGSKGLGYELAKLFAKEKYNLILVARDKDDLARASKELAERHGITCHTFSYDLSNLAEIDSFYEELKRRGLEVSILVNNAGFGYWGGFDDMDPAMQIEMLGLNITGLSHLTRLFVGDMVKSGFGKVLNVSSIASFTPTPFCSTYAASKTYVKYFSLALDYELRDKNVRVSTLCSPDFLSGFQKRAGNPGLIPKGPYVGTAEGIAAIAFRQFMKNRRVITPYSLFGKITCFVENNLPLPEGIKIRIRKRIVEKDYVAKEKRPSS